jgi:hypothetical protein
MGASRGTWSDQGTRPGRQARERDGRALWEETRLGPVSGALPTRSRWRPNPRTKREA